MVFKREFLLALVEIYSTVGLMCFGYRPSEIVQDWLPASLSVIPNTAFLRRVSIPLADVTAWYSPRFRAGRDEMSACVKSIR